MADPDFKTRVEVALRDKFSGPLDEVHVFDGYARNVHTWVASPTFKDMPDTLRQDAVWDALRDALAPEDLVLVSLVLTFDVEDPEYTWALRDHQAASK
jgi:hypothetical protein